MRDGLRAVDQNDGPVLVRKTREFLHGVERAERVGHVSERHEPRPGAEQALVLLHDEVARVVHRRDPQLRSGLLADDLPGDDVGVVLHLADEDLVSRPDVRAGPRLCDEVDGFRRAPEEDHLALGGRLQEVAYLGTRALVRCRRLLGQRVDAPVDVRVVAAVVVDERVDDRARLLARRRVVEVDEGLSVDGPREDRKLLAHALHIERRGRGYDT